MKKKKSVHIYIKNYKYQYLIMTQSFPRQRCAKIFCL